MSNQDYEMYDSGQGEPSVPPPPAGFSPIAGGGVLLPNFGGNAGDFAALPADDKDYFGSEKLSRGSADQPTAITPTKKKGKGKKKKDKDDDTMMTTTSDTECETSSKSNKDRSTRGKVKSGKTGKGKGKKSGGKKRWSVPVAIGITFLALLVIGIMVLIVLHSTCTVDFIRALSNIGNCDSTATTLAKAAQGMTTLAGDSAPILTLGTASISPGSSSNSSNSTATSMSTTTATSTAKPAPSSNSTQSPPG